MLVSIVVYAISFVLIRTLSWYRSYAAADPQQALLTGQPSALASALVKVSGLDDRGSRNEDSMRKAAPMSGSSTSRRHDG